MKKLTNAHVKIVRCLAQGMKVDTIAHCLRVSSNTIRAHKTEIYRRLGVRNASAAVAAAIFEGYITREDTHGR